MSTLPNDLTEWLDAAYAAATAATITIDADTATGPVRLELTRDQTVALARQLSAAWLP